MTFNRPLNKYLSHWESVEIILSHLSHEATKLGMYTIKVQCLLSFFVGSWRLCDKTTKSYLTSTPQQKVQAHEAAPSCEQPKNRLTLHWKFQQCNVLSMLKRTKTMSWVIKQEFSCKKCDCVKCPYVTQGLFTMRMRST